MSITSKAPNPEKGRRYLAQLDQALCNGSWSEVPELARKTDKHAPERKCFTLVARTEAQIASASHRPTSASSNGTSSIHSLGDAVPKLEEAIADPTTVPEDGYCARICLAEIHWLQEKPSEALKVLSPGKTPPEGVGGAAATMGWLEVCETKALFINVAALEAEGQSQEVETLYRFVVSKSPGSRTSELRIWTERLLARTCMYRYRNAQPSNLTLLNAALQSFRVWASFWQRASSASAVAASPSRIDIPRREVWKAYYDLLSTILQRGLLYAPSTDDSNNLLMFPTTNLSAEHLVNSHIRQRTELKRVEAAYESLLLNETQFPKSNQANVEVEEWVEEAVANWKILAGSDWTETELGEGGKIGLGRGMLDILYRAAMKTFHSTTVLRQLFTVHAALGEFDLAMHAFDSYVELVSKGKARAEKTGKHGTGFDNDNISISTAAAALRVLCIYGDRARVEKAVQLSVTLGNWLERHTTESPEGLETNEDEKVAEPRHEAPMTRSSLQPKILSAAFKALGTTKALWARMTYEEDSRTSLQHEALNHLRSAQLYDNDDVETTYLIARVLAESRDISGAITVMKQCITMQNIATPDDADPGAGDYHRQRQLIPIWHLLALCLTARDEFETAMKMCEIAFDQFGDPEVLFGADSIRTPSHAAKLGRESRGVVDIMNNFEKEAILQVKMSQVAFVELAEGAESAVDASSDLLSLYTRLFGSPDQLRALSRPQATTRTVVPPSRSGATLRSFAGSIRPKTARKSMENDVRVIPPAAQRTSTGSETLQSGDNGQEIGIPIAITVTNEDGNPGERDHHRHFHRLPFKVRSHRDDFREPVNTPSNQKDGDSPKKTDYKTEDRPPSIPLKHESTSDSKRSRTHTDISTPAIQQDTTPVTSVSPQQRLDEPPKQDIRLPAPHPMSDGIPLPQFDSLQELQQKTSILVAIWLFIAGLYVRANLLEDASGAIAEASTLTEAFTIEKATRNANARQFFEKGWGGGKSVDELWADIYVAKGELATARESHYVAMDYYEQALQFFPDHPQGIIHISNSLMDIYEEKMPPRELKMSIESVPAATGSMINDPALSADPTIRPATAKSPHANLGRDVPTAAPNKDPWPAELNRLAARDRAYMLLSNLTRLGSGWDNSEAWYTLARAYELSKQINKAKQALWWVVELENTKPMRPFNVVTPAGYAI
ncbi:hypothetical protein M433DRAFT_155753 [Acidomyces richmondensis BFW]|nr:hypothetical protein M433DRAFT_155753 [Acidomyces richmondensis BFW]